jgi:Putative Flp pilus-assembly TadE/G-like
MRRCRTDDGQVVPLLAVAVLVVGGMAVLIGHLGGIAIDGARARTAADAAALAGAAEGERSAIDVAAANGGRLEAYSVDGARVVVVVRVGQARARAEAERATGPATGGLAAGGGDRAGLAPVMVAALARADALLGRPVPVVSGYRTAAEQTLLWAHRDTSPYPVASPGSSPHERGTAIDVALESVDDLLTVGFAAGLCQPLPTSDPVHFEPCPPSSPD